MRAIRSDATRLLQIRTDATGASGWIILDDRVKWFQVLGGSVNAGYQLHTRTAQTLTFVITQLIPVNTGRSDVYVGCPELQIRISNGSPNATYLVACQGDDLSAES
jgi:hypothetical protein